VGRTGTLIAIDIALEQGAREGTVDIPSVVYKIRRQRMNMIWADVSVQTNMFLTHLSTYSDLVFLHTTHIHKRSVSVLFRS